MIVQVYNKAGKGIIATYNGVAKIDNKFDIDKFILMFKSGNNEDNVIIDKKHYTLVVD